MSTGVGVGAGIRFIPDNIYAGDLPPGDPWILATGIWNDTGIWIDTSLWID